MGFAPNHLIDYGWTLYFAEGPFLVKIDIYQDNGDWVYHCENANDSQKCLVSGIYANRCYYKSLGEACQAAFEFINRKIRDKKYMEDGMAKNINKQDSKNTKKEDYYLVNELIKFIWKTATQYELDEMRKAIVYSKDASELTGKLKKIKDRIKSNPIVKEGGSDSIKIANLEECIGDILTANEYIRLNRLCLDKWIITRKKDEKGVLLPYDASVGPQKRLSEFYGLSYAIEELEKIHIQKERFVSCLRSELMECEEIIERLKELKKKRDRELKEQEDKK